MTNMENCFMDIGFYNSYLEVDLSVIRNSIEKVKQHIEPHLGLIPVVKGNAYGMGLVEISRFFLSFNPDMLACGQVVEAAELREAGINCELFVMSGVPYHALDKAIELDLHIPVYNIESVLHISKISRNKNKKAKVHIKIETGLNRIGIRPGEPLAQLLDYIKSIDNIDVQGVYTHFSNATVVNDQFTLKQLEIFNSAVEQVRNAGFSPKYIHCRNTGAVSWLRENISTHVRVGTLLYGFAGMDDNTNLLNLEKEPESWRAFVTNINTLQPGESCGYGMSYTAEKPTRVATIDIGYADGLFRPLATNHGPVLVGDQRAKYLATAMDQTLIDVTDINCKIGDEVTIFGYSRNGAPLTLAELEKVTGHTMTYLQANISHRVKRVYIDQEDLLL